MVTSAPTSRRSKVISERMVCAIVIAASAVCFIQTFAFPQLKADPGGGALFPRIAAGIAFIGALIILARGLTAGGRATETSAGRWLRLHEHPTTRAIVLSVAYPWFITKIGFPISTAVYVFLLMKVLQVPSRFAVPYAVLVAGGLYLVFVYGLEAYVPPGEWMGWLGD